MSFILRIFFTGLIAFVPSGDGHELTVLLVDARDETTASDDIRIPVHQPLLLVRAGSCKGACRDDAQEVADFVFQGTLRHDARTALDQLTASLQGGGVWRLNDSDLSILLEAAGQARTPGLHIRGSEGTGGRLSHRRVPSTVSEREDFSWVAEIKKIDPMTTRLDPDVLAEHPHKGLIAARLTLDAGEVKTYRLASVRGNVVPIEFRSLGADKPGTPYQQALADWVVAEIPIQGCEVEVIDRHFPTLETRRMKLSPEDCDGGLVEMALLNVPASMFSPPPQQPSDGPPEPGRHFERFYDLVASLPPNHPRLVPHAPASVPQLQRVPWAVLHPRKGRTSPLLEAIGLFRGPLDRVICPVAGFPNQSDGTTPLD